MCIGYLRDTVRRESRRGSLRLFSRTATFLTVAYVIVLTGLDDIGAADSKPPDCSCDELPAPPDWRLTLPYERGREITRLKLTLYKIDPPPPLGGEWLRRKERVDCDVRESWMLMEAQRALTAPSRAGVPSCYTSLGISYCLGTLKVSTTREEFEVGITSDGFALGSEVCLAYNVFWSWGLAKLIDDLMFEQTKQHLHTALFRVLSGEDRIEMEKRVYREIMTKYRR